MAIKIIHKPISRTLDLLLEDGKLTPKQKDLWDNYLSFLNAEQVGDLCDVIEKDKESFDSLMEELEASVK